MVNYAELIKDRLTTQEAAERYGLIPNRSGFVRCPFHSGDHTASLRIYPGRGGFSCFGCGASGSVIDLAMRLFDLPFLDACKKLNDDFCLGLPIGRKPTVREWSRAKARHDEILQNVERERADREKRDEQLDRLESLYAYYDFCIRNYAPKDPDNIDGRFADALRNISSVKYNIISAGGGETA